MKLIRVIDEVGKMTDYETDWVPRIGERIVLVQGPNNETATDHYYRVKDVVYFLNNRFEGQVAVLVTEESNPRPWPEY
jgi:hypothetical protein